MKQEQDYTYEINIQEIDWRPVSSDYDEEGNEIPLTKTPEEEAEDIEKRATLRFWGARVTVYAEGGPFQAGLRSPDFRKDSTLEKFNALSELTSLVETLLQKFGQPVEEAQS